MEKIIADIDRAIAQTVLQVREQNDMAAIAQWERIPCADAVPSAIELIAYLGELVKRQAAQ